jgi:hypothetical protein
MIVNNVDLSASGVTGPLSNGKFKTCSLKMKC